MVLIACDFGNNYNFVEYAACTVGSLFLRLFGGDLQNVNVYLLCISG